MQSIKRLARNLWLCVLLFGIYYAQATISPAGSHRWSVSGLGLVGLGVLVALLVFVIKTYQLLRLWLHQQGLFDRRAKLPIRLHLLSPFVICFFAFRATSYPVRGGTALEVNWGWGDPVIGPICFILISLFLTVLQLHHILQAQVEVNDAVRPVQSLPGSWDA